MLSQFKSRELVPAQTEESSKQEPVAVALQITKSFDEEQQAAARLTCDALCSLANGTNATSTTTAPSPAGVATPLISIALPSQPLLMHGFVPQNAIAPPTATARVLSPPKTLSTITTKSTGATTISSPASNSRASTKIKACPKQHQLPLFLSKTYHMIDRCDPDVATWSATGDNFVVKNVEMFASTVLPMYFKHSNFSSFARQLNFYGFRKLRSDPILTNDVDPQTAAYVRFYHEKFQKDRPELLHSIKRATKSDQQSKDDVDDLKSQVFKLKKCVLDMSTQMERKISEMNYEYNRKINCLRAEYEKLTGLVAQLLQQQHHQFSQSSSPQQHQQQQHQQQQHQQQHILPKHVASPLSSHRVHDVPNPPLPPVVETTTSIPNISSATTSVNTCNSGGLSTTTATISSSSLSSNTTATPPHTITSQTMGQEQQQQQKMQSLSHVVAMSLMESSSLSSNTTATPPHTITSQTMGQEQQQQQKMQSLSHAVAMSLMENATTLLAPASDAYLNPGTTPSAEGGSSSNKRAHSDGVTTTGNAPPTVRVRTD